MEEPDPRMACNNSPTVKQNSLYGDGGGKKNLKFKPDIQRKKYEQLASMSTNAINKNKGMHQR